jgi:hypothetical protein
MSGSVNLNNRARTLRTVTPNNPPPSGLLLDGQLAIEQANPMRLWIGVPTSIDPTGRRLLYDASALTGAVVGTSPPTVNVQQGDFWFDSNGTQLYIWFIDPDGGQWVATSNPPSAGILEAPIDDHTYGRKNGGWVILPGFAADPADPAALIQTMQATIEALTARVAALEAARAV